MDRTEPAAALPTPPSPPPAAASADADARCGALRRPPDLRPGDRVAVVAPGGAFDPAALEAGLAILRAWELVPVQVLPKAKARVYAGSEQDRAAAMVAALEEPGCRALWAVRGGAGTGAILQALETTLARCCRLLPRWLVGFSDVTALHARVNAHGLQSLHGANLVNLPAWSQQARRQLFAWLGLGGPRPTPSFAAELWAGCVPPQLGGRLVGGNLTVLASIAGTQALPCWQGAVLFLEDVHEAPYRLDRALGQLRQSGALRGIRAVVLGQLTACGAPALVRTLFTDTLAPLGIPLLAQLPWGHEASSFAVPLGAAVRLAGRGRGEGAASVTVSPC